jgi:hypothetical protein
LLRPIVFAVLVTDNALDKKIRQILRPAGVIIYR